MNKCAVPVHQVEVMYAFLLKMYLLSQNLYVSLDNVYQETGIPINSIHFACNILVAKGYAIMRKAPDTTKSIRLTKEGALFTAERVLEALKK